VFDYMTDYSKTSPFDRYSRYAKCVSTAKVGGVMTQRIQMMEHATTMQRSQNVIGKSIDTNTFDNTLYKSPIVAESSLNKSKTNATTFVAA